ncbi:MAG: shikimate dehydrogenase [Chloroflexota bacterium]
MRFVGLIGYPLGHSVSPPMHQAACAHYNLDLTYLAWETAPAALAERVAGLRDPAHLGANVTVPHKQAVVALVDAVDPSARHVGAINTIVNREGSLTGYNTDGTGFLRALRAEGGFEPSGATALLLGAGGAARGVAFALLGAGLRRLTIANRQRERAERLAADLADLDPPPSVTIAPWTADALSRATEYDLVVNATTIGMWRGPAEGQSPLLATALGPGILVCDLVYNPAETPLLASARAAGARALGGLPMLVYQGAEAFTLWTGLPAPVEVMRAAAARALGGG